MNNTTGFLLAASLGLGMLMLGNAANAQRPKDGGSGGSGGNDPISPALKALGQWSEETGKGGQVTLGLNGPGSVTELEDGEIVVDVRPGMIRFLRAEGGILQSAPDLAAEFQDWLATHPELM